MTTSTKQFARIGIGLYSIPVASRLVGVHHAKVRRWIDHDIGIITRTLPVEERTLSFLELMELYFVKMFRDQNVSLQTIRKAARAAAKRFKTDYPFAVQRFDTDGKTVFATLIDKETDATVVEDLKASQYVFNKVMRPFFRKLEYRQSGMGDALRYWPLGQDKRIVLDPARQFGKPIDSETSVPTQALYAAYNANGGNLAEVADWFDVPTKAVERAVQFESSLAAMA